MICEKCGKEITAGDKFCPFCGQPNPGFQAPQAEPVAPQPPQAEPTVQPAPEPAPQQMPPQPVQQTPPQPIQQTPPQPAQQMPPQPAQQMPPQPAQQMPPQPAQQMPPQPMQQMPGQQMPPMVAMPPQPKKKKTGLIIGIVIAAVVVLVIIIAALASGKSSPEKEFYGDWTATVDYTDYLLSQASANDYDYGDDFKLELEFDVDFKDDNTYTLEVTEDSVEKANDSFYSAMVNVMVQSFISEAPSYTEEEATEFMESYFNVSSLDEYVRENIDGLDYEEIKEDTAREGNFKVEDDKIYFTTSTSEIIDTEIDTGYKFEKESGSKITVKNIDFLEKDVSLNLVLEKD